MITPAQFVTALYRGLLGRDPEQEGLDHYVAAVSRDEPLENVVVYIKDSPEARERVGNAPLASHQASRL